MTRVITFLILIILAIIFLFPFYWTTITSLKPSQDVFKFPPLLIPKSISFEQYEKLFTAGNGVFLRYIRNTLIMCATTIGFVLLVSILMGYALINLPFRGINFIFLVILSIIMIPFQALLVPLYDQLNKMKLIDTKLGLSLIYTTFFMPFCIFMMRSYFLSLPKSLRESALIDGASELSILFRIYLPLSLPALATIIVYVFLETWNDFILSLIFSSSNVARNVQVGIMNFATTRFSMDWGLINAGSVFTTIPTVLIFLLLQKYYVQGLTKGALK